MVFAKKMDTGQQEKNGKPECAEAEQPYQCARHIPTRFAEEIFDRSGGTGFQERRIARMIGHEADEDEHHQEKQKDAYDFFSHIDGFCL
jgi:hypothetical protein